MPTAQPQFAPDFLHDTGLKAGVSNDLRLLKKTFPFGDPPAGVALENGRQKEAVTKFEDDGTRGHAAQIGIRKVMRGRTVVLWLLCASIAPCATDVTAMRRLTHSQYNHTVRDLLGDQTNPANQFPQEDFVNGFKNQTSAQSMPPLLAEAYSAAAEKLARNAFRGGDANHLLPCRPRSPGDAAVPPRNSSATSARKPFAGP